ncbi:MAG: hypothetical protein IT293_12685 [Deltaproteobacteria bacterium]|nr:hypothetical protein [Deltaproteobacteria bacterium]
MSIERRGLLLLVACVLALTAGLGPAAAKDEDEENPHEKMTRSKSVCVDCHTKVPKADEHAADFFLVDTPSEHCLGCHEENEHTGVGEHDGKNLPKDLTIRLPVDENGKVACFTCHDPHPAGLLTGRTVYRSAVSEATRSFVAMRSFPPSVARRAPSEDFGALLRIPAGEAGCSVCHAVLNEASWREKTLWGQHIRVLPR